MGIMLGSCLLHSRVVDLGGVSGSRAGKEKTTKQSLL